MRTANPALNDAVFRNAALEGHDAKAMTLEGTVVKTGILLTLLIGSSAFTWAETLANPNTSGIYTIVGLVGGAIVAFVTIFKPTVSPVTAPIYALLEGLALGGISAVVNQSYPGIALQAVALTFGTLGVLLLAYMSGLVKATENFKLGVIAATGGIAVVYLVTMVLGFFGIGVPFIHSAGWIGIGFSAFVVVIAALNLVLDFDFIENGVRASAPKYMEWYGAFGLLVTLVWLYIEILRLLSKLNRRN
jgi:uncharacterized YccA/Bax inhibitor family protein